MAYETYNPKTGITTFSSTPPAGLSAAQQASLAQGVATQAAVNANNYNIMQAAGATPAQTFATMGGTRGADTISGLTAQQNQALATPLAQQNASLASQSTNVGIMSNPAVASAVNQVTSKPVTTQDMAGAGKSELPTAKTTNQQVAGQYYGQARNLQAEQKAQAELNNFLASQKANGKTLLSTVTPQNMQTLINAVAYGKYTAQDAANELYSRATSTTGGGFINPNIDRPTWMAQRVAKLPGANNQNPDSLNQPKGDVTDQNTGAIDTSDAGNWMKQVMDDIKSLTDQEVAVKDQYGASINELGNQLGVVAPLLQGEQAYQEKVKLQKLDTIANQKNAIIDNANLKMKFLEYSRTLRKDQQEAAAKTLQLYLDNGVSIPPSVAKSYADAIGVDPAIFTAGLNLAAKNKAEQLKLENDYKRAQISGANKPDVSVIGQTTDEYGNTKNIYGYWDAASKSFKTVSGISGETTSTTTTPTSDTGFDYESFLDSIKGTTQTQGFDTPVSYFKGRTTHGGYDIAVKNNTPINAPVSGKVVEITKDNGKGTGWGNSVVIQDAQGNKWRLGHFNNTTVEMGETVNPNQVVGYSGNTGKAFGENGGYHLHIEAMDKNGKLIDIGKKIGGQEQKLNPLTSQALNDPVFYDGLTAAQKKIVDSEIANKGLNRKKITDENLLAYAQEYASTGKVPSGLPQGTLGEVAKFARTLPKQQGELFDTKTGVKPSSITSEKQDGLLALYDVQNKIAEARKMFDEIATTGVASGLLSTVYKTKDVQNYEDMRQQVVDLLGKARSGAALSANEERMYASMMPGQFNEPLFLGEDGARKLENFEKAIAGTIKTKLSGYGAEIVGRKDYIDVGGKKVLATRVYKDGKLGWEY